MVKAKAAKRYPMSSPGLREEVKVDTILKRPKVPRRPIPKDKLKLAKNLRRRECGGGGGEDGKPIVTEAVAGAGGGGPGRTWGESSVIPGRPTVSTTWDGVGVSETGLNLEA